MPADDRLWAENCKRAEDRREPTIKPNKQKASVLLSCGRFDTCRRSTLSCWRRIRISATSFVLGLKNEAMIWRISRRDSIIKWQGYRVSASRLAESNFRYTQGAVCLAGFEMQRSAGLILLALVGEVALSNIERLGHAFVQMGRNNRAGVHNDVQHDRPQRVICVADPQRDVALAGERETIRLELPVEY